MKDTLDLNVVQLEDGINYVIFYILELNKINYVFLANENDPDDLAIRKIVYGKEDDYLERLDSDKEFDAVLDEFNRLFNKKKEEKNEE